MKAYLRVFEVQQLWLDLIATNLFVDIANPTLIDFKEGRAYAAYARLAIKKHQSKNIWIYICPAIHMIEWHIAQSYDRDGYPIPYNAQKISFEDVFELFSEDIKEDLIYHLDLFKSFG